MNVSRSVSLLQIASYVNKSAMDTAVLQRSLAILESMVLNSQDLYYKVAQEITIGQLIPHLQGCVAGPSPTGVLEVELLDLRCFGASPARVPPDSRTDQDIQTYTIAVINALFLKAPEEKRQVSPAVLSRSPPFPSSQSHDPWDHGRSVWGTSRLVDNE